MTLRTVLPTAFRHLGQVDASAGKRLPFAAQSQAEVALVATAAVTGTVRILSDGPDSMIGTSGADSLSAGLGNDTVDGLGGNDTISGGGDNDRLLGSGGNDSIVAGDGNDTMYGGVHDDSLSGGAGFDYGYGESGNDWLHAGADGAWLSGGADNDTLFGDSGEDTLEGSSGNDSITAGDGADSLVGGFGFDTLRGGLGNDTLVGDNDDAGNMGGTESLFGDAGDDQLTGGGSASRLDGGAGDDVIVAGDQHDTIVGGVGADWMEGRGGDDAYVVDSPGDLVIELDNSGFYFTDTVTSGIGAYTLPAFVENLRLTSLANSNGTGNGLANLIYTAPGNNVVNGAGGIDTVSYFYATAGVTVSIATTAQQATGGSGNDTLFNFENLHGGAFDDALTGNTGANDIRGMGGNDALFGGSGNDTLFGGEGNDTFVAEAGNDRYFGENGIDTVDLSATDAGLVIDLRLAGYQGTGSTGTATFSSIENLVASAFADSFTGSGVDNVLDGGAGNDTLYGITGADLLTGGSGADRFRYTLYTDSAVAGGIDKITDFTVGEDLIDLSAFSGTFTYIGDAAFTALNQVRYDSGFVYLNTRSTLDADTVIEITGAPALTAADFIL